MYKDLYAVDEIFQGENIIKEWKMIEKRGSLE